MAVVYYLYLQCVEVRMLNVTHYISRFGRERIMSVSWGSPVALHSVYSLNANISFSTVMCYFYFHCLLRDIIILKFRNSQDLLASTTAVETIV